MWGVLGDSVFDVGAVTRQLKKNIKPIKTGYFKYDYDGKEIKNIEFIEDEKGFINIYEDWDKSSFYVLGGDTAGEGSDNFTAHVIDNITGNQVAVLKKQV